jgi:hypothetical protein
MDGNSIGWALYGLELANDPTKFDISLTYEGARRTYSILLRSPASEEYPHLRIRKNLLLLEISSLDGIHRASGEIDPDLFDHLRRLPWYLLLSMRLLSLREVWINTPWFFEGSFSNVLGTYGFLRFDHALIARLRLLQERLDHFHQAVWPVEQVRGQLQIAKQTKQDVERILSLAGITREEYDLYAFISWALRRFMDGRNQHPDDYDETVLKLTSMLEQLYMRPNEPGIGKKLSSRVAKLIGALSPDHDIFALQKIVTHFYDERGVLLHRVYQLPDKTVSASTLSEISRLSLLAFMAFATQKIDKNSVLSRLESGDVQTLVKAATTFYGHALASLWISEVKMRI